MNKIKAELTDLGGGIIVDITIKDGELDKKVKLPFGLSGPELYEITMTKEVIQDFVDLINRMDSKNEQT